MLGLRMARLGVLFLFAVVTSDGGIENTKR